MFVLVCSDRVAADDDDAGSLDDAFDQTTEDAGTKTDVDEEDAESSDSECTGECDVTESRF